MKLIKKEIQHIANLARLELTDKELATYGSQLSDVLTYYIDQLKEVNTGDAEPTAQVTGMENKMRDDKAEKWPEDEKEAALGQAPEKEGRFIKVKRILE